MQNNVRPAEMERITTLELANAFIEEQVKEVRAQVGDKKVLQKVWEMQKMQEMQRERRMQRREPYSHSR